MIFCSSIIKLPLPTYNISGSFQPPGPAYLVMLSCYQSIFKVDPYFSWISPVVLQLILQRASYNKYRIALNWHEPSKGIREGVNLLAQIRYCQSAEVKFNTSKRAIASIQNVIVWDGNWSIKSKSSLAN
ncbi:5688_t:CDS:2 [Funneliformis mosseae]|uniref:5688_t:CDS:1 n=1 Tax=Funneliformis mosseae TaxID=27381 RepID=A0A9N9HHR1_FUNMO|nr:5688_t:CDS:2 [Funneliformis mosseae]